MAVSGQGRWKRQSLGTWGVAFCHDNLSNLISYVIVRCVHYGSAIAAHMSSLATQHQHFEKYFRGVCKQRKTLTRYSAESPVFVSERV